MIEYVTKKLIESSSNERNKIIFFSRSKRVEKSHKEFFHDIFVLHEYLQSLGKPINSVAIMGDTCYEWFLADITALYFGWVSVAIPESLNADEAGKLLSEEKVDIAFFVGQSKHVRSDFNHPLSFALEYSQKGELFLNDKLVSVNGEVDQIEPSVRSDHSVTYSSGTSGDLKRIPLTYEPQKKTRKGLIGRARSVFRKMLLKMTFWSRSDNALLIYMPFSHSQQRDFSRIALFQGMNIVLSDAKNVLLHLIREKPNIMVSVPVLYEALHSVVSEKVAKWPLWKKRLLKAYHCLGMNRLVRRNWLRRVVDKPLFEDIHKYLGGRPDYFVTGSAPISKECIEFFYDIGIHILEAYGQNEIGNIAMNKPGRIRPGSVGKPLMDIKIADDGEVMVKAPDTKKDRTNWKMDSNGYIHTGDLGYMESGYLYLQGRKDDVVVLSNGKKIFPENLENILRLWGEVNNVMVCSSPSGVLGAVLDRAKTVSESDLINKIQVWNKEMPPHHRFKEVCFASEPFASENGLLTRNLKLRRDFIYRSNVSREWFEI